MRNDINRRERAAGDPQPPLSRPLPKFEIIGDRSKMLQSCVPCSFSVVNKSAAGVGILDFDNREHYGRE